ncbi:Helix-turn-helix domain protein [compost metagenome]
MPLTIKAARVNAGFSRKEVAERLDLSVNGYAKKENGVSKFYIDEVVVLSDLFKVDIQNFFEVECLKKTRVHVNQ